MGITKTTPNGLPRRDRLLLPSLSDLPLVSFSPSEFAGALVSPPFDGLSRICPGRNCGIGSMSTSQRDDDDYDSDPGETETSLVMRRRRAASDDEEDRAVGGEGVTEEGGGECVRRVGRVRSDESDGEGAAAEYDEEEYYSEEGEEVGYGEGEVGYCEEGVEVVGGRAVADEVVLDERVIDEGGSEQVGESVRKEAGSVSVAADVAGEWGEDLGEEEEEEGENLEGKKENEPYAVPTAGAFYMHDDRFRDNVGGRNR